MRKLLFPIIFILLAAVGGWYWSYAPRGATTSAQPHSAPLAIAPPAAAPTATPVGGPGDVYLALGDSLAAGFVTSAPEDAYVARIAAALRNSDPIDVRNVSVPGETSGSLLRRQLPAAISVIEEAQAAGKRVSPITIDIGGNDVWATRRSDDTERQSVVDQTTANIAQTLDALIAATTVDGQRTADIAIMTYYNPYPGDNADPAEPGYWGVRLNEAIERVATERGVKVADVEGAFAGGKVYRYTYIATGDVHANSDGHALIAEEFLEALGYNEEISR